MAKGIKTIWIDSDSQGVLGTKVYRDDILIATVPFGTLEYKDPTALEGVEYKYVTQAYTTDSESTDEILGTNMDYYTIVTEDTESPVLTSQLTMSNLTQTSVVLNCSATDNVGVYQWTIRDANVVYENKVTNGDLVDYLLDGLTPGTQYGIYVKAFDEAGNDSEYSNTVTFTTELPATIGLTPILMNFRVEDANKDRVYFDTPLGYPDGLDKTGFVISYNSIDTVTKVDDNGGYFTVTSPFSYWENNTIRCGNTTDEIDLNPLIHNFSLDDIVNNIPEPTINGDDIFVNVAATGAGDGSSEANGFTTLQAGLNDANGGDTIYMKAGTYIVTEHTEVLGLSGLSPTNPVKIIGYKDTPGDITSNYYTFTQGQDSPELEASEMPIQEGNDLAKYGLLVEQDYVIIKNLQFHGLAGAVVSTPNNGQTNIVVDNCNSKRMYGEGSAEYNGFSLTANFTGTDTYDNQANFRVINSNSINAGGVGILAKGSGSLVENCKCYNDLAGDAQGADYYISISGNSSIVKSCTVESKDRTINSSNHGYGVKAAAKGFGEGDEGADSEYNLFVDCYAHTGGNEGVQARNHGANYNVYKDIEIRGFVGYGYGISCQTGARYNLFERVNMYDLSSATTFKGGTESASDPANNRTIGNIIRNCKMKDCTFGNHTFVTLDVVNEFSDNQFINCTFENIGAFAAGSEATNDYMLLSNNRMINCIISNVNQENNSASKPQLQEMWSIDNSDFWHDASGWSDSVPSFATNSINIDPGFDAELKPSNESLLVGSIVHNTFYDYNEKERDSTTTIGGVALDSEEVGEDIQAPELITATVQNSTPNKVDLVFNEGVLGTNLGFTIGGTTSTSFSSLTGIGNSWSGTLADNVEFGETLTLSYSSAVGDMADESGNLLDDISNFAITNNVTQPDTDAPILNTATIEDSNRNNVVMVFDEPVTMTNLGFSLSGTTSNSFSSVSGSGNTWTGVLGTEAAFGETITISYSGGDVEDSSGNPLADITNRSVTNNISDGGAELFTEPNAANIANETNSIGSWVNGGGGTMHVNNDAAPSGGSYSIEHRKLGLGGVSRGEFEFDVIDGKTYAFDVWYKNPQGNGRLYFVGGFPTDYNSGLITDTEWNRYQFEITATSTRILYMRFYSCDAECATDSYGLIDLVSVKEVV